MNSLAGPRLGVNIDHVATLRNARGGRAPDPLRAARLAIAAGATNDCATPAQRRIFRRRSRHTFNDIIHPRCLV